MTENFPQRTPGGFFPSVDVVLQMLGPLLSLQSAGQREDLTANSFHEKLLGLIVRQWCRQQSVNPSWLDGENSNLLVY